jgi:hypothetical protein
LVLVLAVGMVAWVWGGVTPSYKPRLTSARPECPVNWGEFEVRPRQKGGGYDHTVAAVSGQVASGTAEFASGSALASYGMSLPNAISDVPEFHDCQRMRVPGDTYGPLMAVFAAEKLDSMPDSLFSTPQTVAEVFVPEFGVYEPLRIYNTFNCVVVQKAAGKDDWAAWMVPVRRESQCRYRFTEANLEQYGRPLSIYTLQPPTGLDSSYVPRVARWDWDDKNNKQVIGVRCGRNWCWVGDKAGMEPPRSMEDPEATGIAKAMVEMPGYSDRQQLAEWDEQGKLVPGSNWGTVMPTPALQQALYGGPPGSPKMNLGDKLANFDAKWTHVANVFMSPSTGPYARTLNFEADPAGPPKGRHASIYLCRGNGRFDCRPDLPRLYIKRTCHTSKSDGVRWYAKIQQTNGTTKYYCVVYCQHCNMQIPAVTRWRWRVDDEGIWISCPEGCCETNADES